MDITYSNQEIAALIQERKPLPANWHSQFTTKRKRSHKERHLDVIGDAENEFRIIIRENLVNQLDFSVILAVSISESSRKFRLRRYNGKSHEHTNRVEKVKFQGFHIHYATEKYQQKGLPEDFYAEPTNRYTDVNGALQCLIVDANFKEPDWLQDTLFLEA